MAYIRLHGEHCLLKEHTYIVVKLDVSYLNKTGTYLRIDLLNIQLSWFQKATQSLLKNEGYESLLNTRW